MMNDFVRTSDLNPRRLLARRRCHGSTQRCQYVDRPNDNMNMTWRDKVWFWVTRSDPDDYGLADGWWNRT